jgi:hypothetical protein
MIEASLHDKNPKHKLTLTVSRDVIIKAREAGVNISDITEKLLTVIAFKPSDGYTILAVQRAYQAVFEVVIDLLMLYGAEYFEVGRHPRVVDYEGKIHLHLPIYFGQYIGFHTWIEGSNDPIQYELHEIQLYLHPIMQILENLIQSLAEAAEENKEKISELRFALRLVETLSQDKEDRNG